MLPHLSCFHRLSLKSFADIVCLRPEALHSFSCCLSGTAIDPDKDLIAGLLKRGANPNAQFGDSTVWDHFLEAMDSNICHKFHATYWEILKMMVSHGAVVDTKHPIWSRLVDNTKILSDEAFTELLKGFSFLLNHGLRMELNFWFTMWSQLPANRELSQLSPSFEALTIAFLRHGIDAAQLLTVPYHDSSGLKTWL